MKEPLLYGALDEIKKAYDEEQALIISSVIENFLTTHNSETISYCVDTYVDSELDFKTPGERGLGRVSDGVPRFGGYFRKSLSRLTKEEMKELELLLKKTIYIGYIVHVGWMDNTSSSINVERNQLFAKWIPRIYNSNMESIPETQNILYSLSGNSLNQISDFIKKKNLKNDKIFGTNKTNMILGCYPIVGYVLRFTELQLMNIV